MIKSQENFLKPGIKSYDRLETLQFYSTSHRWQRSFFNPIAVKETKEIHIFHILSIVYLFSKAHVSINPTTSICNDLIPTHPFIFISKFLLHLLPISVNTPFTILYLPTSPPPPVIFLINTQYSFTFFFSLNKLSLLRCFLPDRVLLTGGHQTSGSSPWLSNKIPFKQKSSQAYSYSGIKG